MVAKIQRNLLERKKIESEAGTVEKRQTQSFSKTLSLSQFSIGEAFLDGCHHFSMGDYQTIEHSNLNLRKSGYVRPKGTKASTD